MFSKQWSQVVAKAWADDKFKQRLLANPAAMLKENGVAVPAHVQVIVVENTDKVVHLTLPAKPSGEISEADLAKVAGGIVHTEPWKK
jgi:nitrile hydratase alpha subunit